MERHFDEDLRQLKERLLRMGAIAEEMIQKAVKALHERRDALTAEVFESGNPSQPTAHRDRRPVP
jgi:phosphate transport system protein